MTPISIGVPVAVLPVLAAEAELVAAELVDDAGEVADVEDEEDELHPASARAAARATAGKPAHAPLRRDRVIAALPFLAGPAVELRGAGRSWYLMVTSPLETELRSVPVTCQACNF
jgi:hypothetical protein